MNNNFKKIILENIGRIHDKSEKCRLETSFFDSIDTELLLLSDYFGTTKSQSFFIAVIFSLAYSLPSVDLNDIAEHFECNPMKLLQFNEDFEHLHKKGILKKDLPKGINVILHGLPGTGKTEAALQLAKNTGRDIMKVEISQSKSMWFGESEKLIKRIFTNYKAYSKECEKVPILLFNEADALLAKRLKSGNSGTSQTENAIQNILLEELENFDGILIATTNLAGNLDTAFERRFLFKIEFDKPDISIRAMIWKAKIPGLSEDDCNCLATKFDFSGGQIDNIARKCEIHEIIHGIKVDLKGLIEFCQDEILERRQTRIGFTFS